MADYSYEDVMTALRNADAAGDTEAATRLAEIADGLQNKQSAVRKTSLGEDFQIGLGSAGSTFAKGAGMVLGGMAENPFLNPASLFNEGMGDPYFKLGDELSQGAKDYWLPKDQYEQGLGGKIFGTLFTLPEQMLAMPFSPADTGSTMLEQGESLPRAMAGAAIDTVGNVAGARLPGAIGKTLATKVLSGAGINATQDYLTKSAIQDIAEKQGTKDIYQPTWEDAAVQGVIGGAFGALGGNTKDTTSSKKPAPPAAETKSKPVEAQLLEQVKKQVDLTIDNTIKQIEDLSTGTLDESKSAVISGLNEKLAKLADQKEQIERIINGEEVIPDLTGDVRRQELIKQAKERNPTKQLGEPSIEDVARIDEILAKQPIPEETPIVRPDNGLDTITIPEAVEPKVTPFEVALQKITEAKNMVPAELADRIQTTQERINMLGDDPRTSSLRENLVAELSAYEDIKAGREPDMSWFEGTKPLEQIESINIEAPISKFESIQDILVNGGDITGNFEKAPHLFTNDGISTTKFDRAFADTQQGRTLRQITQHLINEVGLGKEKLYVVLDDVMANKKSTVAGDIAHIGNESVIRISRERLNDYIQGADIDGYDFGNLTGKKLETAKQTFIQVKGASHEIGHLLLNKYLKTFIKSQDHFDALIKKFEDYKSANKVEPTSMFDLRKNGSTSILEMQKAFHEFFAEQTSKVLLHNNTLGAFSKGISKVFSKLINASVELLRKAGVDVNRENFATKLVNDIIQANRKSIANTGETIFERMERINNDKVLQGQESKLFQKNTLEEVANASREKGMLLKDNPFMGLDLKDIPTVSVRLVHALAKGKAFLSRKLFARMNQHEFNEKDPHVNAAYWIMKDADIEVEHITNRLWYGDVKTKDIKWFNSFSKVKNADSPYVALTKATNMDMYHILKVHEKGLEAGLSYEENLKLNGNHLTPDQVKYYNTFSKLYDNLYNESVKIQNGLDKKHILPKRNGWFPSVRQGNYAVYINFGDITAHVETRNTRLQAEKLKDDLEKAGLKHFIVSEVMDLKDQPIQTNKDMAEILRDILSRKLPSGSKVIESEVQRLLDSMSVRGGKLGQHHEYRLNISGYKGSEFGKTAEELGKSYKEAIEQAIAEKGMQIKQLIYKTKLDPILNNEEFKATKPNSHAVIKQMYESSLGQNDNIFGDAGKKVDYFTDKICDELKNSWNEEGKTSDKSLGKLTEDVVKESFFFLKMMAKPVFSIISQFLSVPMTIAHMSKDAHGLMAYKSFTKGTLKLVSGDKVLWDSIKRVSQTTNTFEPQFVESIAIKDSGHPVYKQLKNWLFLQAPGKASEAASRVGVYSVLYTHYTDLGLPNAERLAIDGVGKILNLYDKANTAPIFDHLGIIGDVVKPLQGYGQNALGKTLNMIMTTNPVNYKTWGPLVNFTLLTIATTGVMGMPFVQEYEKFRRWVNKTYNDFSLPSILDIFAADNTFLDRFVPGEGMSTKEREAIMYSIPSALTGIDLTSSARANETLPALILSILAGAEDPSAAASIYEWAGQVPGAITTMGQAVAGKAGVADTAKAIDVLAPSGPIGYGIKEVAGVNKTNVFGKETNQKILGKEAQANGERTGMDIAAGLLGTKTTKQRYQDQIDFQVAEDEQNLKAKLDRLGVRFTETGNPEYVRKMAELGATKEQIESKVKLEMFNRLVPQDVRLMINRNGKMIKGKGQRAAVGLFNFRGN